MYKHKWRGVCANHRKYVHCCRLSFHSKLNRAFVLHVDWVWLTTNCSGMAPVNDGSHRSTCHPHVRPQMEWAILAFISQPCSIATLWPVLISCPAEGRMVSWPGWLVTYQGGLPIPKWSTIPVVTGLDVEWLRCCTRRRYHYAKLLIEFIANGLRRWLYTASAASMLVVEPGLSSSTSVLVFQLFWKRTSVDEWPRCCRPSSSWQCHVFFIQRRTPECRWCSYAGSLMPVSIRELSWSRSLKASLLFLNS